MHPGQMVEEIFLSHLWFFLEKGVWFCKTNNNNNNKIKKKKKKSQLGDRLLFPVSRIEEAELICKLRVFAVKSGVKLFVLYA